MDKQFFGTLKNGQEASVYTIANTKGMELKVTDYGVNIVSIVVNDKDGNKKDVILGYDSAEEYENAMCYFGATIGRNCNRISDAKIEIDGITYELENNDRGNNLHSGSHALCKVLWSVKEQTASKIVFFYHSPDLEEGYPGNADVEVTVEVTEDNDFLIALVNWVSYFIIYNTIQFLQF